MSENLLRQDIKTLQRFKSVELNVLFIVGTYLPRRMLPTMNYSVRIVKNRAFPAFFLYFRCFNAVDSI